MYGLVRKCEHSPLNGFHCCWDVYEYCTTLCTYIAQICVINGVARQQASLRVFRDVYEYCTTLCQICVINGVARQQACVESS